jgi:RNA polymerase sigma-70 factor (ECF subfamily)
MFEIEEIDCAEIAETVGVPLGTIYSRLHAARDRFRREFERCAGNPLRRPR